MSPEPFSVQNRRGSIRGVTLVELMMSFTILAIGALGFIGAFMTVSKSIHTSKTRAVANNLLQEKVEAMKNISYYRLLPTTAPLTSSEADILPFQYDPGFYPPESMTIGDITYTRRVFVEKVSSAGGGEPTSLSWQAPDPGLKRIKVYTLWQDQGKWRMMELQNLINNPNRQFLSGFVKGTVAVTAGVPTGATVMVSQNASWFDQASSAGSYGFYVSPGTYTLRASLFGYFTKTLDNVYVGSSSTYTWSPTLTQMSSGTITGTAYLRDHLVISRVVGSTCTLSGSVCTDFDQEYVELYNPTTWTWTVNGDLGLNWQGRSPYSKTSIVFNTVTNSIAPNHFYLFANEPTVTINGTPVPADAVWEQALGGPNDVNPNFPEFDMASNNPNILVVYEDGGGGGGRGVGALELTSASRGVQDRFGWQGGGSGVNPGFYEGTPYPQNNGLDRYEQFRRFSTSGGYSSTVGPAYDSNVNASDWDLQASITEPPRYSGTPAQVPTTGTPAAGAYVSADDGLSDSTQCITNGTFNLSSVATGTWNVSFSKGALYISTSATVASMGSSAVLGAVALTSSTSNGFATGYVRAAVSNSPLSGITVQDASGASTTSGGSGRYTLVLNPGLTSLTANPGNLSNTSYVSDTINNVTIDTGTFTTGQDFTLKTGGELSGTVSIGGNPLPGIPVSATDGGGTVQSEAVSDTNGSFLLRNLSTGTYSVDLQLEAGETYSPGTTTMTITSPGQTVFVSSFSVTSAFGWITGSLTATGLPIKTGVLVLATTTTISGTNPPDADSTLRSGVTKYYSVSSLADGTYELHLPGGNPGTPTSYNVYAWYTQWNGTTPTVIKQSAVAAVTGEQTTSGVNFSW